MSIHLQARFLRVLEHREVLPLGASQPRRVDFRLVAASRVDLQQLAGSDRLREDLYYRLNVVRIRVPPLRERRADIPLLFAHFLSVAARRFRREIPPISDAVRHHLLEHDWPGNVRELQYFADRIVLGVDALLNAAPDDATESLPQRVERFEASIIRETLAATDGDVRTALAILQIPRKTFYDKLHRHGIDIDEYRGTGRSARTTAGTRSRRAR